MFVGNQQSTLLQDANLTGKAHGSGVNGWIFGKKCINLEKDVKFTDKKGKQRVRQGCSPIREGVVNIKPDTTMEDLLRYVERVHERWGIRSMQIHIHKDEGHYEDTEDTESWEPNYHAHIIWDWMDHDTGKSFKLNAEDMSAIQE